MKVIEILLKQFESFVKRAMMPSVSFVFIFLVVGGIYINEYQPKDLKFDISKIFAISVDINIWFISLILFIGLSFFLSILTQIIYDNLLKWNFHILFRDTDDSLLKKYRDLVIKKLKDENKDIFDSFKNDDFTDNNLYIIISRELSYLENKTNTNRYVDDTKSIGIFFVSIILSILFWCTIYENISGLFICLFIGFVGYEIVKAKYRSRAIRIYINYLIGEN